ncbi:ferrous iron transport protein B [Epilithonimonas tenax]|uniref:ferrous iron transport protein B n=1 Tax=Epilithonimonas tenax TaxID=191577 RepID=UPI0003FF5B0D|nr:ferrous iron transport protein B [Epilithonimonas tenax]
MQDQKKQKQILLVGNPNVGKSTLFNSLCNRKQKTGNYAGVTVASLSGNYIYNNEEVEITDLPGSYSIYPTSEDEAIFSRYLIQEQDNYIGVLYIADAINMKRSLLLFQQIQDLGIPILMVVNQIDEAEKRGIKINTEALSKTLNVEILRTNAKEHIGIDEIREAIFSNQFNKSSQSTFEIPIEQKGLVYKISQNTKDQNLYKIWTLLAADTYLGKIERINEIITQEDAKCNVPKRLQIQETVRRYQNIDQIISETTEKIPQRKQLLTEKLDRILVHPVWGYLIFFLILLLIFQSVFFLAEYPMNWIEGLFSWFSNFSGDYLPEGPINSLISNGILPGVGGIVIFAPQIGILLYFLYLLEDSGYMARVIFLMDRFLRPFGLNGKSIVPLVSGTACAIPAIMSTRNIENIKERLITILVTPFMTCSARLPVYSIIIGLIIPDESFYGIKYRALALLSMYLLGFAMSLFSSLILKNLIKTKVKSFLVMDLPTYKMPLFGYDFKLVLGKVWEFISGAGKVIFTVSIILWTLSYFGPSQKENQTIASNVKLEKSYLGKIGRSMEPAIAPLGYDWKMGIGILTSFAAREVFVGTLSTLYSLDDEAPEGRLIEKMRLDTHPNGDKVFSFATGVSILLFYAFAMQCISTIAVVYRETQSLKWTLLQTFAMTFLAYISALVAYQILK